MHKLHIQKVEQIARSITRHNTFVYHSIQMEQRFIEKINGLTFYNYKIKVPMHFMHNKLWGLVKGTTPTPQDLKFLVD